jgi:deoxyribonucleoside regulator
MPRKPDVDERLRQVLKVAHLFYEKEMTKTDISHEIRASTTQVARLLAEAREQGYVRIEFNPPKLYELGEQLKSKYGLQAAVVVSYADDLVFLRRMIGKAAAQYFEEVVGAGATVALGGGDTMYEMVLCSRTSTRWCW